MKKALEELAPYLVWVFMLLALFWNVAEPLRENGIGK